MKVGSLVRYVGRGDHPPLTCYQLEEHTTGLVQAVDHFHATVLMLGSGQTLRINLSWLEEIT